MKCNIFTENLSKFIEEDMEESMKQEMEEHMLQCEACRQFYEEELLIEKIFAEALSFHHISFTSQKQKIMNKIEEDKYINYKIKKSNRKLVSNVKVITSMAAAILAILLINPISRFNIMDKSFGEKIESVEQVPNEDNKGKYSHKYEEESIEDESQFKIDKQDEMIIKDGGSNLLDKKNTSLSNEKNSVNNTQEKLSKDIDNKANSKLDNAKLDSTQDEIREFSNKEMTISPIQEDEISEKESDDNDKNENIKSFICGNMELVKNVNFNKQSISDENISRFLYKSIESPNINLSATLAEKKYSSIEKIYVEDLNKKEAWLLEANFQYRNVFSRFIKWADNENLFVIIDEVRDNIIISEEVYILNVNTGNTIKIYTIRDNVNKVEDINIVNKKDIELKLRGIKNDNQYNIYIENYKINDFSIMVDK